MALHRQQPADICLLAPATCVHQHQKETDSYSSTVSSLPILTAGNGTSDLFYDDDSVLFIDMHQDGVWPGSGKLQETGAGRGEGFTLNIPLPSEGPRTCF